MPSSAFLLLTVQGMDDECCAQQVATRLGGVEGVAAVAVDPVSGRACLSTKGEVSGTALAASLAGSEYALASTAPVAACPEGLKPGRTDAWAGVAGLDAKIVSHGEAVDLAAHAAAGKYTVYDFGAPWCEPCYATADKLKEALAAAPDLAVRAVVLDGGDPKQSFALPVVKQYLQFAEGLPWLKVVAPDGKKLYEGSDVTAALASIRKARSR